jgi:hypothetical protein
MKKKPRQVVPINIKLTKTEQPRSTDPASIKPSWSFFFGTGSLPGFGKRLGSVELSFLTLMKAVPVKLLVNLPFDSGSFFFQQVLPSVNMETNTYNLASKNFCNSLH